MKFILVINVLCALDSRDTLIVNSATMDLNKSKLLVFKGEIDSAHIYIEKARKVFYEYHKWEDYVTTFRYQGFFYFRQFQIEKALKTYTIGLKFSKEFLSKNNVLTPILLQKLGLQYFYSEEYGMAINAYLEALDYFRNINNVEKYSEYVSTISGLSSAYLFKHDLINALEYSEKLFDLVKKNKINLKSLPNYHLTRGKIYYGLEDYTKSLKEINIALNTFEKVNQVYNTLECNFYLGSIERQLKNYDNSHFIIDKGINHGIGNSDIKGINVQLSKLYIVKGRNYFEQRLYLKANRAFDTALSYSSNKNNNWIRLFAGDNFQKLEKYDSALKNYQLGIIGTVNYFNNENIYSLPKIKNIRDNQRILLLLKSKAEAFFKKYKYEDSLNYKDLYASYNTSSFSISVIDNLLKEYTSFGARTEWSKTIHEIYQQAINTCHTIYQLSGDNKYKEEAFQISEKSKALILVSDLQSNSAKYFSNLPDSLLEKESEIKTRLAYQQSELYKELNKAKHDSSKISVVKDEIFVLKRERESLENHFETQYPKYHQLKYDNNLPTVSDIQKTLDSETTLIEYFVGDSSIFVFTINKQEYNFHKLVSVDSLFQKVSKIPELLLEKDKAGFSAVSYKLYNHLIEPLNVKTSNIIIIPDGELWHLNFDLLIQNPPTKLDYRKFDYLIKDYTISYTYSSKLLKQDHSRQVKPLKNECLAFSYNNPDDISVGSYIALRGFRNENLGDLPGTRKEIKAVSSVVEGAYYYGAFANERNFKEKAKDYNILHLALHGVIDEENPQNSKLYFTQNKDTLEDNYLHAYELYSLELNAELAVLSACKTGSGKLIKGEGIMSLGRAFTYAGCKSLILSQWDVSDAFTPALMKEFYKNLKEGKTKSSALREAKLTFLSKADNLTSNPYYWAPLIQLGDNQPLKQDKNILNWFLTGCSLLIILMILWHFKLRRKNL